ncbi:MAG: hypothetical protein F4145_15860 [Boseongicola sp. SB0675_bin_26]|nr:hypothetical protein [Boseongicola sp. SB0675_bin_26]
MTVAASFRIGPPARSSTWLVNSSVEPARDSRRPAQLRGSELILADRPSRRVPGCLSRHPVTVTQASAVLAAIPCSPGWLGFGTADAHTDAIPLREGHARLECRMTRVEERANVLGQRTARGKDRPDRLMQE